jgi:CRP/FNR family transcriptional regulator
MLVPSAIFSELLGLSAAFRQFVFQAFGERLSELILLVESVALRRLDIRLAERLLQLAGEGQTEIRKTHQELAAELGTAREVISRYLKEFERKGWLQRSAATCICLILIRCSDSCNSLRDLVTELLISLC